MERTLMSGRITAVSTSGEHAFSKHNVERLRLLAGLGVEGDAHAGVTVKHRSRVRRDPTQPNLRQVHLLHAELHDELHAAGFDVAAGALGENLTTRGIALLDLPRGTRLHLARGPVLEITGLRNPCAQIDAFQPGLLRAVLAHDAEGRLVRKAGVMSVVLAGGDVAPGDTVELELPAGAHAPLEPV
jgi:MOSC domain-containing protein YiiM